MPKKLVINFFLLALLVVALRLPSLDLPLDNDSSEHAFFARQMIKGETLYDTIHTGHHLPGIYYTFVLAFKLFGDNPVAPKLLLIAFAIVSAWLITLMGRMFFDDVTGILGAVFYSLVTSQALFSGTTAQMEYFANLPLIATVFLFLILLRKSAFVAHFFWVGVLAAISVLYKTIFIGSLVAVGISIVVGGWVEKSQAGNGKKVLLRLGFVSDGFVLPLALTWGYFASKGLSQRLMLVFTLGYGYFMDATNVYNLVFPKPFGLPFVVMAVNNIPLLAFSLIGVYRLVRDSIPMRNIKNLTGFTLALWAIASFASAGLRGGGYEHYALVAVPPLAIIGANEISHAYHRWNTSSQKPRALIGSGIMSALIIVQFIWINYDLYHHYIPYKIASFLHKPAADLFFQDSQQAVIEYIKSHTSSNDLIYVWSNDLTLYYSVDRLPPVDILMPYYVSATGPPQRIFDPRTKYIILEPPEVLPHPQWLTDGLNRGYFCETTIIGKDIYRRIIP